MRTTVPKSSLQRSFALIKTVALLLTVLINILWFIQIKSHFHSVHIHNQTKKLSFRHVFSFQSDWAQLDGAKEFLYVYSTAYYDDRRTEKYIRVITITKSNITETAYCHFFNSELKFYKTVRAVIQSTTNDLITLSFSDGFVLCPVDNNIVIPTYIQLTTKSDVEQLTYNEFLLIPVSIPPSKFSNDRNKLEFAACIQPTYNYDDANQLIQWMEFQLLMGVERFTFYNISIGPKASCVLNSYGRNIVEVLKWTPPNKNGTKPQMTAQNVQVRECTLRYRDVSKYVVNLDFDEYIIPNPKISSNYSSLIEIILDSPIKSTQPVAQFQFQNGLFGLGYPSTCDAYPERCIGMNMKNLQIYKHTTRLKEFPRGYHRTKYITRPELVIHPGIHFMTEAVNDVRVEYVSNQLAYVHHYRKCSWSPVCSGKPTTVDISARHFAQSLFERLQTKYESIKEKCNLSSMD